MTAPPPHPTRGRDPADPLACPLHRWQVASGLEPAVRVGIVLDADALATLRIDLPDSPYALTADQSPSTPCQNAPLVATHNGDGVTLRIGDQPARRAAIWRLAADPVPPLRRGVGACVRGVVAGRGFHWRKNVDQTLGGTLELRAGARGIMLVNELPLEAYLAGVITAEMGGACPAEFLKAQCVVARSWLLAMSEPKHEGEPFDRCNDDCCQRYQGTDDLSEAALAAVAATRGTVLRAAGGEVVDANYSKSCGGISEPPETVWGISKPGLACICDAPPGSAAHRFMPVTEENLAEYLDGDWQHGAGAYCSPQVVPEATFGKYLGRVDEAGSYFRWTVQYTRSRLEELLRRGLPECAALTALHDLRVTARGPSGRASEVAIDWDDGGTRHTTRVSREYRIRQVLHEKFLYSSAFAVHIERDAAGEPATITLRGAGWGHGAGLCQIGALGMALQGCTCEQICKHYFPPATLERVYK